MSMYLKGTVLENETLVAESHTMLLSLSSQIFPVFFLDGFVTRFTSYGFYISQLIRFARVSSYVTDFNARNRFFNW